MVTEIAAANILTLFVTYVKPHFIIGGTTEPRADGEFGKIEAIDIYNQIHLCTAVVQSDRTVLLTIPIYQPRLQLKAP